MRTINIHGGRDISSFLKEKKQSSFCGLRNDTPIEPRSKEKSQTERND